MLNIERRSWRLCGHTWLALLGKVRFASGLDGWGCCSTVCWLGFVHLTQRGPSGRKHFGIQKQHHAWNFICMSPKQMSRKKWPGRAHRAQELAFLNNWGFHVTRSPLSRACLVSAGQCLFGYFYTLLQINFPSPQMLHLLILLSSGEFRIETH